MQARWNRRALTSDAHALSSPECYVGVATAAWSRAISVISLGLSQVKQVARLYNPSSSSSHVEPDTKQGIVAQPTLRVTPSQSGMKSQHDKATPDVARAVSGLSTTDMNFGEQAYRHVVLRIINCVGTPKCINGVAKSDNLITTGCQLSLSLRFEM